MMCDVWNHRSPDFKTHSATEVSPHTVCQQYKYNVRKERAQVYLQNVFIYDFSLPKQDGNPAIMPVLTF